MKTRLTLLLAASFLFSRAALGFTTDLVVESGATAYDSDGVTVLGTFGWVGNATVNDAGTVAFCGVLQKTGTVTTANDEGIWVVLSTERGVKSYKVAREGEILTGSAALNHFPAVAAINNNGKMVFLASLKGGVTTDNNQVLLKADASAPLGGVTQVARKGDLVPDQNGATSSGARFLSLGKPIIGDDANNTISFGAVLKVGTGSTASYSNNLGIWKESGGSLIQVARKAANIDSIPSAPTSGGKFGTLIRPVLNGNGFGAFHGTLRYPVSASQNTGIWNGDFATPASLGVLQKGDAAPLTPTTFTGFSSAFGLNNNNEIAIKASIKRNGFSVTSANDSGVWAGLPNALDLIAQEGDAEPSGTGATFGAINPPVVISDTGDVAFVGVLRALIGVVDATNSQGLWAGNSVTLSLIARCGSDAPDETGVPLAASDIVYHRMYSTLVSMNENGQLAFRAMLRGDVTPLSGVEDDGIWATLSTGVLVKIVRDGDAVGLKTVRQHRFAAGSGGSDGRPRAFTYNSVQSQGQLVYTNYFTDSSTGVYIALLP